MKILTVTHFYESHRGGIELVAGRIQRELASLPGTGGHDVQWAASSSDPAPKDGVITPVPLRTFDPVEKLTGLPMPVPFPSGVRALWRAVRNADAVIIHDALYVTSILAMLAAKWHRKRTMLIQHIGDIPFSSAVLRGVLSLANALVAKPMLRRADHLVFISETVQQHFGDLRRKTPAQLIFNGVDHQRFFMPDHTAEMTAKLRWNMDVQAYHFLFVGRFVEKKGLNILREIARQLPDTQFHLAGSGPIDPQSWGLPNVIVHGAQSPDAIASLMHACDAFILPSTGEGYPLVVQEALACGLHVFCGEETARADPEAGEHLYDAPVNLADLVGSASGFMANLQNADVRKKLGAANFAKSRYDWAKNASIIAALLDTASPSNVN